jgi:hypothetical protein
MTTNLHDKMLAAIDAYFSASDGTEEEVAENLLLDVRDEINKQYRKAVQDAIVGGTGITKGGERIDPASIYAEPKIGCVNHDCDKCKAVQEPVAKDWEGAEYWMPLAWELCADECGEEACTELIWEGGPIPEPWGDRWLKYEDEARRLIALVQKHTTPPAPQPVPVKTYHDGKPWPVAPKPWVGLTYQEQKDIINNSMTPVCVVIATEAKLREKNGGAA